MAKKKRSWLAKLIWPQAAQRSNPRVRGFRNLTVERLEARALLSGRPAMTLSDLLVQMTPDPQPSGDMPANTSQLVPLVNYAPAMVPPDLPENADIHNFVVGLEQIESDIANNPDARPAYWGENVAGGANEYRVHFDDNGMLLTSLTVTWGDGSGPQTVPPQPWVVHQYPTAGNYTIQVTAAGADGAYSATSTGGIDIADIAGIGGSGSGLQMTLSSVPPTLHVAGPQTVAQVQTFALDNLASFSDPNPGDAGTFSDSIDWGDSSQPFLGSNFNVINSGANGQPYVAALTSSAGDGPLTHVYSNPGTYYLVVTVTDATYGISDTQTIPIAVVQLAPTITTTGLSSGNTCDEGTTVGLSGTVAADPSLTDPITYNWQITDSEGNTVFQGTDPAPNYTFTAADAYTVSLVTSVDNVQSAPVTATITVSNVAPSFVQTSLPTITASIGQTVTIPPLTFTDPNPNDTHTVTVNWDSVYNAIPLDTGATVNEETMNGSTIVPGTITDSYAYASMPTSGGSYTATVTLTDSEGQSTSIPFTVNVVSADVALTGFTTDGTNLDVAYSITGATAGQFDIGIYTSPDGSTPDQELVPYTVNGTNSPLTIGNHTAVISPAFDDIQSNYHLIALTDANSDPSENTVEFAGGIFVATSVAASPPQNILYVFGSNGNDPPVSGTDAVYMHGAADGPNNNTVIFDGGTPFPIGGTITGIHVRGEYASDTFEADTDVTLPLWLYGGNGTNTLVGGAGSNLIVGGSGTNTIHSSNGVNTPQIVDDSDLGVSGLQNIFQDAGTWNSENVGGAFNSEELQHASSGGSDYAAWTFANLDPSAYYDVYVTSAPIAGASTTAQYSVWDGGRQYAGGTQVGPIGQTGIATVNQTIYPADYQTAGEFWHDLGVFQVSSGMLVVQLGSGEALADAAMIVPYTTRPLTNLTMDSFAIGSDGNLSVTYTVGVENSAPFSIGFFGSPDGVRPADLLQSYEIDDPTLLAGGGQSHTVGIPPELSSIGPSQYLIAQLDCDDQVEETTKDDNNSVPLSGVFQNSDNGIYVFGGNAASESVTFSQGSSAGTTTVAVNGVVQQFTNASSIFVATGSGNSTVDASGATLPLTAYAGSGNDNITGGQGNAEIYGGSGADTITGGQGNNWLQAGSGDTTIYGGPNEDWIMGGAGNDTIYCGNGPVTVRGGSGNDHIYGGGGLDNLYGGSGTNWIYGNGAHDILQGGPGNNFIQPYPMPLTNVSSIEVVDSNNTPTFDGTIDNAGNPYTGDYQAKDPAYGGVWSFNDLDSGVRLGEDATTPIAVYANWQPTGTNYTAGDSFVGTHWAYAAEYEVFSDGTLLGSVIVNQSAAPGQDSPEPNDRPWTMLGVWNVSAGQTLTVDLVSGSISGGVNSDPYGALCAGDVMIHAIWPTVSIRPTNVVVNPLAANAGDYVDWVDSWQSMQIPVEVKGPRLELQFQASIEELYTDIQGASLSDWDYVSPEDQSVDFWNAASGGTKLTAVDGAGDLVNDAFPSSGVYSRFVYVSMDAPAATLPSNQDQTEFHAPYPFSIREGDAIVTSASIVQPGAAPPGPIKGEAANSKTGAAVARSDQAAGQLYLRITVKSGPALGMPVGILRGHAITDTDSGQAAVQWKTQGGGSSHDTNAVPPAKQRVGKTVESATWTVVSDDEVHWDFPIPATAVEGDVVLLYTDVLQGTDAEEVDIKNSDGNTVGNGKGDMPAIIGSWTVKKVNGSWVIGTKGITARHSDQTPLSGPDPTKDQIKSAVDAATAIVNRLGYQLKPRLDPTGRFNHDTGYDIVDK
jgi:Ca2+-binding RTX toxin-like protein